MRLQTMPPLLTYLLYGIELFGVTPIVYPFSPGSR